ncbi:MAG: ABC transporter permease [Labilithrix sp.]|nr:ABC transporter permease [Labilithrix sp.]MCW5814012.1 ABC transporter permease [Labilithrix sp.]
MSALDVIVSGTMLAQTIRMTIPYACASLGGVLGERSGIVNIGLEGILLSAALAAVAVNGATGSGALGIAAGVACGAAIGLGHAALVVKGRIDAIVSGLAINLAAAGGTRVVLRALYDSSSNSPTIPGVRIGGGLFVRTLFDPFVLLTVAACGVAAWMLARTRLGLRLRACGEDPAAAQAVGVDVAKTRMLAVALGGAACGLGGAALAFELHQFQSGMTGGRGFIALAAVIVAGWRPWRALAACAAFATLDALQIVLQNQTRVPSQLFGILPFAATLVALAVVSRRKGTGVRPPAGIGKHPV